MKLLIISAAYPPAPGGVATHVSTLAHSFIKKDKKNECVVLTTKKQSSRYSAREKGRLQVFKLKTDSVDDFSGRRTPFEEIIKFLMERWHSILPDIIHVHDFDSAYIGLMLKTAFKTPLIFTYHRAPSPWRDLKFQENPKDCFLEAAKVYKLFDSIVVPSNINKKLLIDQGFNRNKIKVIKHGLSIKKLASHASIDSILAELKFNSSKTMIMCPVRLDEHKDAEVFIRAASILKEKRPDNKFVFVLTDVPEGIYETIPQMAETLGLKLNNDLFLKRFEYTQMATIYRKSAMCVIPSVRESFGQTVIESFVYRTPVIAANSGALPEIVKNKKNGLLFTPGSYNELVDCIQTVLDNSKLRNELVESALLDAKENYNPTQMIDKYIELYEEIK